MAESFQVGIGDGIVIRIGRDLGIKEYFIINSVFLVSL